MKDLKRVFKLESISYDGFSDITEQINNFLNKNIPIYKSFYVQNNECVIDVKIENIEISRNDHGNLSEISNMITAYIFIGETK